MDTGPITRALSAFWADRKNRLAFLGPLGCALFIVLVLTLPAKLMAVFFLTIVGLLFGALIWMLTRLMLEDF